MRRAATANVLSAGIAFAVAVGARTADAAEPWVDRPLTLPRLNVAFDTGLGIAHVKAPGGITGAGLNLEVALGLTSRLEIGFRTGGRFGNEGKVTQADAYGRTFDTETYGTGVDAFANPEGRITWSMLAVSVVDIGLEGRAYLPFETG